MKKIGFVIGPQGFRWQDTYYDKFQKNPKLRPWLESVPSKFIIDEDGHPWKASSGDEPFVRIDVAVGYGLKHMLKDRKDLQIDIIPASDLSSKKIESYDLVINQFFDGLVVPFLKKFESRNGVPQVRLMRLYDKHADRFYPPMDYHKLIMNKCDYYQFLENIGETVLPTLCYRRGENVNDFVKDKLEPFLKTHKITQLFTKPLHGTDSRDVRLFKDIKDHKRALVKHIQTLMTNPQYPGIVMQKFAKEFETKTPQARMYFIGGKYMYTVLTKQGVDAYLYNESTKNEIPFDELKRRAQKVIRAFKPFFGGVPMFLTRVDFGCCVSKNRFFINEVEFNGGNYVHMDTRPERRFMYDKLMIQQLMKVIEKKVSNKK